MPTYAYACTQCGHQFDAVQSFSDAALTACPECSGTLRKQYGSIGVTFNGSGFYRTDSRSGSGAKSESSASSKTETSTSAKPAPAAAPASS
ncbi:FmdB family zinc ribbon protein [Microbacterium sp. NPDC056234]|uniref:FmdB family zinc ribbon protein n=1 Tax=Microbacterium sp. NPDC056234 TaxID=3345757 RepID=UPI0035D92590